MSRRNLSRRIALWSLCGIVREAIIGFSTFAQIPPITINAIGDGTPEAAAAMAVRESTVSHPDIRPNDPAPSLRGAESFGK
jgi:hypothetical protein